jgi:shikimate kinase
MNHFLLLIGYRATGKTTLARMLGERLQLDAVDTDPLIEQKAGRTIANIFAELGEPTFRDYESQVIAELLRGEPCVIATGGGLPVRPANRELLKRYASATSARARVVWLKASPETILQRMSGDPATERMRPQLTNLPPLAEIVQVLNTREPIYRELADLEVDTEDVSLSELADRITCWWRAASG